MICETIASLAENYPHQYRATKISQGAQTAVRHYIDQLYDSDWKKQQDEWIELGDIYKLELAKKEVQSEEEQKIDDIKKSLGL